MLIFEKAKSLGMLQMAGYWPLRYGLGYVTSTKHRPEKDASVLLRVRRRTRGKPGGRGCRAGEHPGDNQGSERVVEERVIRVEPQVTFVVANAGRGNGFCHVEVQQIKAVIGKSGTHGHRG